MKKGDPGIQQRNDLIYADYQQNVDIKYLAKLHKISVTRVNQIIAEYRKNKKLANRAFDTAFKVDNEESKEVIKKRKEKKEKENKQIILTFVKIGLLNTITVKASEQEILKALEVFETPLDRLQNLMKDGKIDEAKAARIMNFLDSTVFIKLPKETKNTMVMPRETTKTHSELENEPNEEDRMKGISFGGT